MKTFEKVLLGTTPYGEYKGTFGGTEYRFRNIYLYDDNGIITEFSPLGANKSYDKETNKIELLEEDKKDVNNNISICIPARRAKENFTRKENFFIPRKDYHYYDSYGADLYLYVDNDTITLKKLSDDTVTRQSYRDGLQILETHYEVFEVGGELFRVWNSVNFEHYYKSCISVNPTKQEYIKTDFGKQVDKVKGMLEDKGISMNGYILELLVRYFDITERENVEVKDVL